MISERQSKLLALTRPKILWSVFVSLSLAIGSAAFVYRKSSQPYESSFALLAKERDNRPGFFSKERFPHLEQFLSKIDTQAIDFTQDLAVLSISFSYNADKNSLSIEVGTDKAINAERLDKKSLEESLKLAIANLEEHENKASASSNEPHDHNSLERQLILETIRDLEKEYSATLIQSAKISKEMKKNFPTLPTCDRSARTYGYVAPISPYIASRLDALCSYLSLDPEARRRVTSNLNQHSINHSSLLSAYNDIRSRLQTMLVRENVYLEFKKQALVKRLKNTQSQETLNEAKKWIGTANLDVQYLNKPNPKRLFKATVSFVLIFIATGIVLLRYLPTEFKSTK